MELLKLVVWVHHKGSVVSRSREHFEMILTDKEVSILGFTFLLFLGILAYHSWVIYGLMIDVWFYIICVVFWNIFALMKYVDVVMLSFVDDLC